jgi:putative ABC transport system permease protein
MPRLNAVHANVSMLLYAIAISLVTGLIFGIAPAIVSLRRDLVGTLKEGRATLVPGPRLYLGGLHFGGLHLGGLHLRGLRPGTILIAFQIALSMMLGCCATVLTGSFWRILHTPRGFEAHNIMTASISLPTKRYPEGSDKTAAFYASLLDDIRRMPGVSGASAAQSLPLSGQNNSTQVNVIGAEDQRKASADLRFVDPDYFRTLRVPLLEGRNFNGDDRRGRTAVVIVNHAFARRFLSGQPPIGAGLSLGWGGDAPKLVVGVAGDILHDALGTQASPEMYVPMAQFPVNDMAIVLRTPGDIGALARMVREKVRERDPALPVEAIRTLDEYLLISAAPQRFLMWVLLAFASGTLLLATIGLYGTLSYSAVCRQHEFGVRMALGSSGWGVMSLVLREGLGIAVAGMASGLALTIATTRFLRGWLYATSPLDASSLLFASIALLAVAGVACWLPARRATQVNPLRSLSGN